MEEEEEVPFVCEKCGKQFSSENSLKMHTVRVHGKKKGAGFVTGEAEEEKVVLPSLGDYFSEVLKLAGVGDQQIQQILIKATEINLEDLYQITALLKEFGLTRDRIRTVINLWSVKQHIPIPPDLKRELGILVTPQPFSYDRTYQPYSYYPERYEPQQVRRQESETYSLSNVLIAMLQSQNNLISQLLQQKNNKSEDSEKTLLLQKLEKMEEEQQKLKEELKQKELEKLENAIMSLHEELTALKETPPIEGYKSDEFRLIAESLERISKTVDKVVESGKIGERILDGAERLMKWGTPAEPSEALKKEIEKTASGVVTILEQIEKEYVAEK